MKADDESGFGRDTRSDSDRSSEGDLPNDFNVEIYYALNPDVKASGANAKEHYLTIGATENRKYKVDDVLPKDFDPADYVRLNADVADSDIDPANHYLIYGIKEGRAYKSQSSELPADFNEEEYLQLNPDVVAAGLKAADHFLNFGQKEGRLYKKPYSASTQEQNAEFATYPWHSFASRQHKKAIDPKIIAFYLPQYHRIKENDEWWGEGFTEWTNVKKAIPNFKGHYQPHIPLNENYYDLSDIRVQQDQAELAQQYGVHAFCYYMYWFAGRRILEKPLDNILAAKQIKMPFCICWANENWTRTWDGRSNDILLEQTHSVENDRKFILDAITYLKDERYLRIDGKLVLLVYRVDLLHCAQRTAEIWREEVRRAGLGDILLCAVQFYGVDDPTVWGFDAAVEFPPHGFLVHENLPDQSPTFTNKDFSGTVLDYDKVIDYSLKKPTVDYTWYRGIFPGWDNTARRQNTPHIFDKANPFSFEKWLTELLRQTVLMNEPKNQLLFINAWNEWGEGAHLEPDERFKNYNLCAVHSALKTVKGEFEPLSILARLRRDFSYEGRWTDERLLLNILRGKEQALRFLQNTRAA